MNHDHHVSPWRAGLTSRCPRCGKGKLFSGFLSVGTSCDTCGLDYGFADSGDGPAIFVIFAAGTIVVLLWAIVDALVPLPPLVHLMIWIPVTIVLCLALLRPFKAVMIALQFANNAREGRPD